MTELLDAALRYAGHGWSVFPCRPRLKVPATAHGLKDATKDQQAIVQWWTRWPHANVAIVTGRESGIVVLDVDAVHGGDDALYFLEAEHGELPRTASITTPRGGQHYYFAHPGMEVRNSAGKLGAGLDVRGDGGYVLAPPSLIDERRYEADERAPLAPLPEWLLDQLADDSAHTLTPAGEWIEMVRNGLREGERNSSIARVTGHLLRRWVDVDLVAELVHLVNAHRCSPPLSCTEVDRIVDSIAGRELRRRQKAAA